MPGPWITNAVLKGKLADLLSQDVGDLLPKLDSVIADSNAAAAGEISGALFARGFTVAQIDAWDRRVEFNTDIGLFWCLTKGGMLANFSDLFIQKIDRRKELVTLPVLISGVLAQPGGGDSTSPISGGRLSESGYRFTMDNEF